MILYTICACIILYEHADEIWKFRCARPANCLMLCCGNDGRIGAPEITISHLSYIDSRDQLLETLTCGSTPITPHRGDNLTCFSTHCKPKPDLIRLLDHN